MYIKQGKNLLAAKIIFANAKTLTTLSWLVVAFLQITLNISRIPVNGKTALLDDSWAISLGASFQEGYISGRDFHFTYGPLAQFLSWLAGLGNSTGSFFDDYGLWRVSWGFSSAIILAISVTLIKQITWKYALFIYLASSLFNTYLVFMAVRPWLSILYSILFYLVLNSGETKKRLIGTGIISFLCFLGQLISDEIGIYAIVSLVSVLIFYIIMSHYFRFANKSILLPASHYWQLLGIMIGVYLLSNIFLSFIFLLSSPNYTSFFDYQKFMLETLIGYNYTMGSLSWEISASSTVLLILIVICSLLFVLQLWRKLPVAEGYLFLCLVPAALLNLKSIVVRSDLNHITRGFIPFIFFLLLLGIDWTKKGHLSMVWLTIFVTFFLVFPASNLQSFNQITQWLDGKVSFVSKLETFANQKTLASSIVDIDLIKALNPDSTLLSFPYDNYIPIGLNRKFVAPVLQSYAAFTPALQNAYNEQLDRYKSTLEVIYGLDNLAVGGLEGVQQVSRVPIIFEYLYTNFEAKYPKIYDKGYLILQPRQKPINLVVETLQFKHGQANTTSNEITLSQTANCSMVRITAKINYPFTSFIGRPTHINLTFTNGLVKILEAPMVAIVPGQEFATYFSLMNPAEFYKIFINNEKIQTQPWNVLNITPLTGAFLDISPSSIQLNKIECVKFNVAL